jgi:phosphoglycolate phosphatase
LKYKQVIWDWNGTLFDDAALCVTNMNCLLAKRGLTPLTPERYQEIFDFPVERYYHRVGFDFGMDSFAQLSDEFIAAYEAGKLSCGLRQGAVEVLEAVHRWGVPQAILSASKQSSLEATLAHFGIRHLFGDVLGLADHHAAGKLEIGKRWIQAQAVDPGEMVLIGDTVHDHELAQATGVDCLLIFSGHQSRSRLEACGVPLLSSLDELLPRLGRD